MSFFVTPLEDGSYALTTGGYVLLVGIMVVLLIFAASVLNRKHKMDAKQLAFSAVAIALGFLTSMIKLIQMPMGGSVTLFSMLFITLIGYWYGLGAGLATSIAYGILQMMVDPYIISLPQMLVDYILAFGALGFSGFFCRKKIVLVDERKDKSHTMFGMVPGYILGVLGRFLFSILSGVIFFGAYAPENFPNPVVYSAVYNISYLGLEAIITLVVIQIPPVAKALEMIKRLAVNDQKRSEKGAP